MATEIPLTVTHYSLIIRELNALVIDVAIKTEKQHHVEWLFGISEQPLFALPFACIGNCAEIMNFIMRTHPLHFTTSSTSFHEFIYFIELTHSAAVAEGDECDS